MTTETAPGRRERKKLEIRDRLYASALDLFVERGFEATTMDDIAERADVARATVFNHFPQKTAFLFEWGQRRRDRVAETMASEHVAELPAADRLRRYLSALAELNIASRRATVTLMDASVRIGGALRSPNLDLELAKFVDEGRRAGEFRSDVDSAQAGTLLAAGYFSSVLRWISSEPEPFDLPEYLDQVLTIILRGITA